MMTQMANPNHLKKNSTEIFRVFTILYTTKTRRNISFDVFFFSKAESVQTDLSISLFIPCFIKQTSRMQDFFIAHICIS